MEVIKKAFGFESFEELINAAKDLPSPEKIPPKARDAFRTLRQHSGQSIGMLGIRQADASKIQQDAKRIEYGTSISTERALEVIKQVWGADSFEELIKDAEGLPRTPLPITEKDREAVRTLRSHTRTKSNTIKHANDISSIANAQSISPERFLGIIKKVWGFDSIYELHEAVDGLPKIPKKLTLEIRGAIEKYLYYTDQIPEKKLKGDIRGVVREMQHVGVASPSRALEVIKEVWGFESFEALLRKTKNMPSPPGSILGRMMSKSDSSRDRF